jgi:hypothetical protein
VIAPDLARAHVSAAELGMAPPIHLLPPAVEAPPRWDGSPLPLTQGPATALGTTALDPGATSPGGPPRPLLVSQPIVSFEGLGDGLAGFVVTGAPPDPVGDVGPSHYVQMVNTSFAVFDKASGAVLHGPAPTNTLFAGFPGGQGLCASTNQGDGIVLHDALADRWFLSQYAFALDPGGNPTPPFYQCVAISQTPDPAGAYFLYAFGPYDDGAGVPALNDYAKFAAWPDAYYASYNMFYVAGVRKVFAGPKVCALDRARMLAGEPASQQCFQLPSTFGGLLPADLDGKRLPPDGSPGYLLARDVAPVAAELHLWRFHVDWTAPSSSRLAGPHSIGVERYADPCLPDARACVPQPAPGSALDALGDRLMHRLAYRNFGGHEALVVTHTVSAGGRAGVRWYELRSAPGQTLASSEPSLVQQGTHAPADSTWRWMGSIAQDHVGDIAVGFSASSATEIPSIRYAARAWNDPAGAMEQGETTLHAGSGVQTVDLAGRPLARWGDYSALAVDPVDDCTFWYTNQYFLVDGVRWRTRIGSFALPACPARFSVALPACAPLGGPVSAVITSTDGLGATLHEYGGPAVLGSSDASAAVSELVSFRDGRGVAEVAVAFGTRGRQSLTVTDAASPRFTGSATTTVGGGYAISLPPVVAVDSAASVTVTGLDVLCTVATGYGGTATFASSDPAATLPARAAFAAGVASKLSVTFRTPGVQTLTVTDASPGSDLVGTASVVVVGEPSPGVVPAAVPAVQPAPPGLPVPAVPAAEGGEAASGGGGGCSQGTGTDGLALVLLATVTGARRVRALTQLN